MLLCTMNCIDLLIVTFAGLKVETLVSYHQLIWTRSLVVSLHCIGCALLCVIILASSTDCDKPYAWISNTQRYCGGVFSEY